MVEGTFVELCYDWVREGPEELIGEVCWDLSVVGCFRMLVNEGMGRERKRKGKRRELVLLTTSRMYSAGRTSVCLC